METAIGTTPLSVMSGDGMLVTEGDKVSYPLFQKVKLKREHKSSSRMPLIVFTGNRIQKMKQ